MKVIIVAPYFHPHVGGVEAYTLNIARQLRELRWQVVVVTTAAKDAQPSTNLDDLPVYYLTPALSISNTPVGVGWRRELGRIFRTEQPDIVNAHMPVPYLADVAQRASKSIPFALTYHNDVAKSFLPYDIAARILHGTVIDKTLRRSTRIIATSDYYAKESSYLRPYLPKVSIVPPGVDLSRFHPEVTVDSDLVARYRGRRVLLFVGSMDRTHAHKGLDILIDAFSLIRNDCPDVCLVVVGQGDALDRFKSMAAKSGAGRDIDFVGYVGDDRIAQYYKLAKILVVPSTNRSEGFGMVSIEANAVGTPVIGSRVGGVPYAVQDNETGLLVEPNSAAAIYRAARTLLTNDALSLRLGMAGAARAQREFDWTELGKRTSEIFMGLRRPFASATRARSSAQDL